MKSKTDLDRIDCEMLAALQKNGRLSNKELAARVGIAASTCVVRLRRLISSGVLKSFHAVADPQVLGIGLEAIVAVQMHTHSRTLVESFRAHALALPEVVQLYHMSGSNDFLVHVAVRDSDHLKELAMTAFTTREEVSRIETSLIFEHADSHELPIFVEPEEW